MQNKEFSERTAFTVVLFDASVQLSHRGQAGTTRAHTLGFSYTILGRIAEVVKAFPCLYFRVRLVFRHRGTFVCLSQIRSAFLAGLSGGVHKF